MTDGATQSVDQSLNKTGMDRSAYASNKIAKKSSNRSMFLSVFHSKPVTAVKVLNALGLVATASMDGLIILWRISEKSGTGKARSQTIKFSKLFSTDVRMDDIRKTINKGFAGTSKKVYECMDMSV